MRLLLDTHVVIWALVTPEELSDGVAAAISDPDNDVFVSTASVWEIAIKEAAGKLRLPGPAGTWLMPAVAATGISMIEILPKQALEAAALPKHHGDPFDRMLIAQARDRGCTLVSRDARFPHYDVALMTA